MAKIGIFGTRGIPARYGGFETFAEELSTRLVAKGHQVTVFNRRFFGSEAPKETEYNNVKLRWIPTVAQKYLETPLHALFSFLTVRRGDFDCALICNGANSPFAWILKLKQIPTLINVDGIERKRSKWNLLGRLWYQFGERCSVWFATRIIADADVIHKYYLDAYGVDSAVIAYGADAIPKPPGEVLKQFRLESRKFILYVSRLEPENNALGVVKGYKNVKTDLPLVIVGDAPYAKEYINEVRREADPRVIFTGYQFGESYRELQSHAAIYIQASEVGGTHPALVEAMAYGNCIVANDVPEHREVLGDAGSYYEKNDFNHLSKVIDVLLKDPTTIQIYRRKATERAREVYSWDKITTLYEELIREVSA